MTEDDDWSYDVGEIGEEERPDRAVEESGNGSAQGDDPDGADDDDGWRFSLEDLEEDDEDAADEGWFDLSDTVEAGSPDLENVVFVLLGVALGVVVAIQLLL